MVSEDLEKLPVRKIPYPQWIKQGITNLEKDKDVVKRPADKGGGLVIMSKAYYREEMHRQLSDRETYKILNTNPTMDFKNKLADLVAKGYIKDILNKKKSQYLNPSACRIPIIYFLPKIHKNATKPPGRPIINSIGSVCARLGQYIDHFLQPLVSQTEACTKDTKHVIQCLNQLDDLDNCILATSDLYIRS